MKVILKKISIFYLVLFPFNTFAASLANEAKERGINETCYKYLAQIENSYKLSGLNITFAHPENSSEFPSLHVSLQNYNNGSSSFSATLMPDDEYCYLSTVLVTAINNQSCSEIVQIKSDNDQNLNVSVYADGN